MERIFLLFVLSILFLVLIISFYLVINMIHELAEKLMKGEWLEWKEKIIYGNKIKIGE